MSNMDISWSKRGTCHIEAREEDSTLGVLYSSIASLQVALGVVGWCISKEMIHQGMHQRLSQVYTESEARQNYTLTHPLQVLRKTQVAPSGLFLLAWTSFGQTYMARKGGEALGPSPRKKREPSCVWKKLTRQIDFEIGFNKLTLSDSFWNRSGFDVNVREENLWLHFLLILYWNKFDFKMNPRNQFWHISVCQIASVTAIGFFWPYGVPLHPLDNIERYRSFKPWPFSQHLKYMKLSKLMGQFQTGEARHALTINHPIIKDELFSLSLFTSGMAQREMDLLGPPRSRLQRLSRLQTGLPRHKGLRGW